MNDIARVKPPAEVIELTERHVASVRTTAPRHRVRHTIALLHEMVMDAVGLEGLAPAGPLFTVYHSLGSMVTIEAGLPLSQTIRLHDVVAPSVLPGGPALYVRQVGDPEELPDIRQQLEQYGTGLGYRPLGSPWECYLVDGRDTPDSSEWITDTYIPVTPLGARSADSVPRTGRMALPLKQAIR